MPQRFCRVDSAKGDPRSLGRPAHIDPRINSEFIDKLARAGLVSVFWGIETGSQHVVDLMNKRYHHPDARRILRECSRAGIAQCCPIIIGFPGETPEDVAETVDFILEFQDLPLCRFLLPAQLVVRPNSPLHDQYAEFGLADNNYYGWCTCDGTNTLADPHRAAVRGPAGLRQSRAPHGASRGRRGDSATFPSMKPTRLPTSIACCDELFRRAGCLHHFHEALDDWAGRRRWFHLFSSARRRRKMDDYALVFQALDKDSPDGRKRLYQIILDSLQALKMKMHERSQVAA